MILNVIFHNCLNDNFCLKVKVSKVCGLPGFKAFSQLNLASYRGGSRIWLRGAEFFWPIFVDSMQQSCANKVSSYWLGSRAQLRALEALGVFITKYVISPFWGTFYNIFEIIKY